MITVPEVVEEIIQSTPYLEEALAKNLLNFSAVARDIQPEVERTMKKVQEGSIIMALRRLSPRVKPNSKLKRILTSQPEIIVRSNLYEVTIANSDNFRRVQRELLKEFSTQNSYFMTITHGVFETTIIASSEAQEKIRAILREEKIISEIDTLSSITIKFPVDIIKTPGVYYTILKSLAWEGIPFTEVVSTYSENTIILKEEYVDRAFSLVKKVFR